jgi:hypothetical protein
MTFEPLRTILKAATAAGSLAFACAFSTDAHAQPLPPEPPAVYITTASPSYYEGHAVYYYNSRWGWRDPHGWHWYEHEPAVLHEHRVHAPPARYHYEHRR